ncbi:hypothetical protein CJU89_2218 [Yarrowia sp. B02]|nr:hypothetical protein CJU89_2218 [Yarrowia sp. B02]
MDPLEEDKGWASSLDYLDYGPRLKPCVKSPSSSSASGGSSYNDSSPTLDDILNNNAQPPYSLSAFSAYLSSKHCLETLEFITDAQKYASMYEDSPQDHNLRVLWQRMMLSYMERDSPRELNIPYELRDGLCELPTTPAPSPSTLSEAVVQVKELMKENGYYPFITQVASEEMCCCHGHSSSTERLSSMPSSAPLRPPLRTVVKHRLTSPASSGSSSPTQQSPVTPPESPSLFEVSMLHSEKATTSCSPAVAIVSSTQFATAIDITPNKHGVTNGQAPCESPTESSWRRVSKKLKWRK